MTSPRSALESVRADLVARVADLTADVAGIVAATADANADDEHDPEGATIAWEREQASESLRRTRTRLAEVDAALQRLDAGTYGECVICGGPIGEERLVARPSTDRCVGCAIIVR